MEDDARRSGPFDEEALERLHGSDDTIRARATGKADVEDRPGRRVHGARARIGRACGTVPGLVGERGLDVTFRREPLDVGRLLIGRDRFGGCDGRQRRPGPRLGGSGGSWAGRASARSGDTYGISDAATPGAPTPTGTPDEDNGALTGP